MSRYEAAHANATGPGDARPTALQIVADEGMEGKLKGKVVVITGTSSGIGIETVRALAVTGATIYCTARNVTKAKTALAGILDATRLEIFEMDQDSFASVRAAAQAILAKTERINILINNAGIMAVQDLQFTKDGHELQFGTNHLSHFLFFELLKPALLAGVTPDFHSRVVNLSSSGHRIHGINESDNYNFQITEYTAMTAYGQSKTANIYMANEIERRYGSRGLHATSVHPGLIRDTGLSKHMPAGEMAALGAIEQFSRTMKSLEQGAATTVWAAIAKEWGTKGGRYLVDCTEGVPAEADSSLYDSAFHAPFAYDAKKEERLWKDSLKIVGLVDNE